MTQNLIHLDVKNLARLRKVGNPITSNLEKSRSAGVGYDWVS